MGRCAAALLGCILLLGGALGGDNRSDENAGFILTEETLGRVLAVAGTSKKQVIATTFKLDKEWAVMYMLKNFGAWLQKAGMLQHTLLITQDEDSWRAALGEGLPCFLDRSSPTAVDFPAGHRYAERTFDFSKNYWALKIIERGYSLLYLDSDVIVLQDPFRYFDATYDLQGLSDYRAEPAPELPPVGGILEQRCELYRMKRGTDLEGGDLLHPSWELEGTELATSMRALTPCLSLGLWYIRPGPASQRFLTTVMEWMVQTHHHQWDQAAWNEVLPAFTMGMGDAAPLRFRLLPVSQYANIEVWLKRKEEKLKVDPVILHAGFIKGSAKAERMKELGFWAADNINTKKAEAVLQRYRAAAGGATGAAAAQHGPLLGLRGWVVLLGGVGLAGAWVARRRRRGAAGRLYSRSF